MHPPATLQGRMLLRGVTRSANIAAARFEEANGSPESRERSGTSMTGISGLFLLLQSQVAVCGFVRPPVTIPRFVSLGWAHLGTNSGSIAPQKSHICCASMRLTPLAPSLGQGRSPSGSSSQQHTEHWSGYFWPLAQCHVATARTRIARRHERDHATRTSTSAAAGLG